MQNTEKYPNNMKYSLILLTAILFSGLVFGQKNIQFWEVETENDYFWKPNSPIIDGYTLWLLRQKLSLDGYQIILENEYNINKNSFQKIRFTNYLPLLSSNNFSSMIGTRYNKYTIPFENSDFEKEIRHLWLWTAWQYRPHRWNLTLTTENYFNGDQSSLYEKTGNKFFSVFYLGYEVSNCWNLLLLGGYAIQQMENQTHEKPIIALQARYQSSPRFKCLFGVPTIFACEWTCLPKTDIGLKYFISGEYIAFLQQRFGEKIYGSIQYKQDLNKSDNAYFDRILYQFSENENAAFNNVTYQENQLSTKLGILIRKNLSLNIGVGYNFSSEIELYNNDKRLNHNVKSMENIVMITSIQFLMLD